MFSKICFENLKKKNHSNLSLINFSQTRFSFALSEVMNYFLVVYKYTLKTQKKKTKIISAAANIIWPKMSTYFKLIYTQLNQNDWIDLTW